MKLPNTLLDNDGYPTEEWLQFIREYKPSEKIPIMEFVEALRESWWMHDWGFKLHRKYKGIRKLELHTGGWSGNEEIMREIKSNIWLIHGPMKYVKWHTGGHFYFEIKIK